MAGAGYMTLIVARLLTELALACSSRWIYHRDKSGAKESGFCYRYCAVWWLTVARSRACRWEHLSVSILAGVCCGITVRRDCADEQSTADPANIRSGGRRHS